MGKTLKRREGVQGDFQGGDSTDSHLRSSLVKTHPRRVRGDFGMIDVSTQTQHRLGVGESFVE